MTRFLAAFSALVLVLAHDAATPAAAGADSGGMTVAQVAAVMRGNGFELTINEDGEGEPVIFSEMAGFNFALFGFNCEQAAQACHEFMFSAWFDPETAPSVEIINKFNERALAGRAYVDAAGDAHLEHLFSVSEAGDADLIRRNLAIWETVIVDFADHIGVTEAAT